MDFTQTKNKVVFDVALKLYPLEAIFGAAYVFLDRCYVYLDQHQPKKIQVHLKSKENTKKRQLEALADDFFNELLHQTLRLQIARRTAPVREMIVGRALLSAEPTGLQDEQDAFLDTADYLDDPLGIAVPWEEKYGRSQEQVSGSDSDTKEKERNPEPAEG